jgi:hypothetical protein
MDTGKSLSVVLVLLMSISILAVVVPQPAVSAQYTGVEIVPDANTVILDHLDGTTVGEQVGTLNYLTSLPGLHLAGDFTAESYIIYRASTNLEPQGTVELWLNPRTYGRAVDFNWGYTHSYPPAGHVLHLGSLIDGRIAYSVWNPSWPGVQYSNSVVPLNEWTHVAVSWGPSGTKIYINGNVDASTPTPIRPAASFGVWVYLNHWGGTDLGYIDEFHVSNIQRTDDEIRSRVVPLKVSVTIDIDPDTLNLKSKGKFVTCYIELPEDYSVEDIDIDSVALTKINDHLLDPCLCTVDPSEIGDYDDNGIPDLTVKFDRQELIPLLGVGEAELTVTGELVDGPKFEGTGTIRVID